MTFEEILAQARELLQRKGRVSYRALKLQFTLDDEYLAGLKDELVDAERVAVDEDGKVLVWVGAAPVSSSKFQVPNQDSAPRTANSELSPASYTPLHLAERIRAEQRALEACGSPDGERKTITALFADIQDSTALIEDLDPEEARRLLDPALQLMMDAVHRYEGFVVQPTGDGIFALFGAPIAHEDHPQRALFAALLMQAESKRYAEQLRREQGLNLQIRVGVNTGEVVLRAIRKDDLHTDYTPVGHSIHLAARMESLASGGAVVVSEGTYKLIAGYFECKALGEAKVKGVTEPVPIYEVLVVGPLRTRLQVSARRGFTRFVGRQSELEQLRHALAQATTGHGQIVGVMGEPGLGKSRLFYEFTLAAQGRGLVLEASSVSYGKASPYLPVLELLKTYFQLQSHDDERTRREKVGGKVLMLDRRLEETLPYLFVLLGMDDPTSSLQQMDPQLRRQRTLAALKQLFLRESLNQPLLLIFEDLHWIDSETQGFLDTLSESVASARLLLLVNYRPEYRHEWGQKTYYTQLRLAPLGAEEAGELLTALLGNDESLTAVKRLILEKTDGTPFFMEEVVQTLAEEGVLSGERGRYRLAKAPTELHLSPTVQGVLAARIDRLSRPEKELLQHLAVIGREFPLSLVRQVLGQPEEELYGLLSSLQSKEFLYEQPAFPEVEYLFKHALTQEVAYNSVLIERRKVLHERTAQAIESLFHSRLEDHYSELAHHYTRSGNTEKAVEYLHLAGQQAVQRSANVEAITHLTTALELLTTLPDTHARAQQELLLQVTLGTPLQATRGFSSPEVKATYTRARELCQQVGETRQLFPVLFGLRTFHHVRGAFRTARELGEQLLGLAQREHDPALLMEAYQALGSTLFNLGEFSAAQAHLEQSLTLYGAQRHYSHVFLYGIEPGVIGLCYATFVLWHLGYPDQARQKSEAARTLAQERFYPYSLGAARGYAALLHQLRRESPLTQEWAEAGLTLAREQGFPLILGQGAILQGWALAEQGQSEEGITQIRQGLATCQAIGSGMHQSYYLALLAEAYGKAGQAEEGLAALAEALTVVDTSGERFYEAELYRLKGTLTLQSKVQGPRSKVEEEAEAYFQKAIEIARHQQAKSLELRAVMSLSRLWQQQGKNKEAHRMLSEIYNWFTEGFDTKDLQEAKALIEELNIELSSR
ncbi:MAG TPA: adenylate/guanylate cyclase domain-containing protein [Candidatus Binatia bacterium]|nr:adenylate/guanylate cyclase domain-containing protein [Candidatus Binatia bacterium]